MERTEELPVAVIGAGPVGLAAAARLVEQGMSAVVLEAGDEAGSNIRTWGHVRLFSPWRDDTDAAAVRLLSRHGWGPPDGAAHPTGDELVDRYLAPLAALPELRDGVRFGARVTAITRADGDKRTPRRDGPFSLAVSRASGGEQRLRARAVIDASGSWATPNPLGAAGAPAAGERDAARWIRYGIPDVLGAERDRYADRAVAVVGSGHSAHNVVQDLATLAEAAPATRVVWVVRGADPLPPPAAGQRDVLPARQRLTDRTRALVDAGAVELVAGFAVDTVESVGGRLALHAGDRRLGGIHEVVAVTGVRPDLAPLWELRVDLDPVLESPRALAPLIDPARHDCATVPVHGAAELAHPELGFYIVGMKSYGRAPTFLAKTGYQQAASVVDAIAAGRAPAATAAGDAAPGALVTAGAASGAPAPAAACGPAPAAGPSCCG